MVLVEMALEMLMLMRYRATALALELPLSSQLFATFMRVVILLMGRDVVRRRNVGGRAITLAVTHGEDNRRYDNAHLARAFLVDGFILPEHSAERARLHHFPVVRDRSGRGCV
jgi:hypothetical protein